MICDICYKGIRDNVILFRQNKKGEDGKWRCQFCNKQQIDDTIREIAYTIYKGNNQITY